MSNQEMTLFSDGGDIVIAPEFQALVDAGETGADLGGGIGGGYGILSTRGGKFRVKYQGTETPLLNDKDEPVGSVEAVILKANPYLTKQYYEDAYSEGDSGAPVCFSTDGKVPSPNVESPVHERCDTCPMNRFGSKITPAGVKVKACSDNKKLAIVPLLDLENKAFNGPMLFRVPASALKDLLAFSNKMSAAGFPYYAVAVRIGLDIDASYPKPTFKAMRPLTSEEAQVVVSMRESDQTDRLLADFGDLKGDADGVVKESTFEQDEQPAPPARAVPPAPPVARKPAPVAAKPAPAAAKPAPVAAARPVAPAARPAAPKAAATPAPPAARPAAARPAPRPAPPPAAEPEVAEASEPEAPAGDMESEIADILADLNAAG